MKQFRLYYDKDKETVWLQDMVNQGWALEKFFLGVYTFAPCEPGEYNYQIDMLKSAEEYDGYRQFMEDSGVEVVCRWNTWVILRKRAEDGPFQLYSDAESQIQHYTTIRNTFRTFAIAELLCFLPNFVNAIENRSIGIGLLSLFIGAVSLSMARVSWKCSWKIEELKKHVK